MIKVVMDTSALISLELIGALGKSLRILDVIISETVKDEITEISKYKDVEGRSAKNVINLINVGSIKVIKIKNRKNVENLLSRNANKGEAECFVCCLENKISQLIMDDIDAAYSLEGFAIANKTDIKISIAVLMELYFQKMIAKKELKMFIKKLVKLREWEGGALEILSKKYLENL